MAEDAARDGPVASRPDAYYYKDALLERPRFSKFRRSIPQSPEFKRWSDNAEIVPRDSTFTKDFESEKPVVVQVIHGTAGDFAWFLEGSQTLV